MKRAFLYVRVSTDEQAKHGYSIGAQLEFLRNYAKDHGYTIVGEFIDEGVSGKKGYKKRPAMRQLMESLDQTDVIIFLKLDRWFRSVANYYETQPILEAHHVDWIAAQEDYETVTATGKFKVNIMLSVAQNEAERTAERINFVFDNKRAHGEFVGSKVPLGYFINQDRHVEVDPEKSEIALDIFQHFIDTHSATKTRDYVLKKYGMTYTAYGLKELLKNEKYLGTKDIPTFIPKDVFLQVQEIFKSRSSRSGLPERIFLFSDIIYCSECGRKMRSHCDIGPGTIYYTDSSRYHYGAQSCQHKKYHREVIIEKYLLENLASSIERSRIVYEEKKKNAPDPEKIQRKITKLRHLYLEDLISKEDYEAEYRACQIAMEEIPYRPSSSGAEKIVDSLEIYDELTRENKKAFWNRTIKRIEIDNDGNISIIPI